MMSAMAARLRNGRDILELYAMNECFGRDAQRVIDRTPARPITAIRAVTGRPVATLSTCRI